MKKLNILITLTAFLFIGHSLFGQGFSSDQIDSLVSKALELTPSVGVAVAVVKDGKVIHLKGYGLTSNDGKKKVNENTLFAIASNSKAFTTAALSILVDEGKLSWQDKVVDHIPQFKMYNDYVTANFNITDLVTHRSGLGLGAGDLMFIPDGADFSINDVVSSFQFQKPTSAFRTQFDYDNLLYLVAGEVVARVSGMSWGEFVTTRIFKPLGMNNTVPSSVTLNENSNLAMAHRSYGDEIKQLEIYNVGMMGAAGGIYSSANDLSKWMLMQLNRGKYGENLSNQIFSERSQSEMWKPQTNMEFNIKSEIRKSTHFVAYGLGWFIFDVNGKIVIEHGGALPGMLSRTMLIPEQNLGVVILTNSDPGGYAYFSLSETIIDSYLEIEKKDWVQYLAERTKENSNESDSVTNAVWETIKKSNTSNINLNDYVGDYEDDWFGKVELSLKGDQLWFTSKRSPKLNGQMYFYKATTFAIKWEYTDMPCDAFATFNLDEEGKTISIKMKGISPNIDFSFDFHDLDLKRVDERTDSNKK